MLPAFLVFLKGVALDELVALHFLGQLLGTPLSAIVDR